MSTITVFTPTYNRAHLLPRLYASLCAQTCKDFCWLVVDDGSTDGTGELVQGWIDEGLLQIRYAYKPNGGMHTAHNLAYDLIDTELNVCIDSDDMMPVGAIASIISSWSIVAHEPKLAGMLGLDRYLAGGIVGSCFPENGMMATLDQVYGCFGVRGDKKIVLRTDVVNMFPRYPEFQGERLVPIASLYMLIGEKYKLLCLNEVWAAIEYQPDGSTATVRRQYFQSPMGFRHEAAINIRCSRYPLVIIRNIVKLGVMDIILKRRGRAPDESPAPIASLLFLPFSFFAYLYLRVKVFYFNDSRGSN